MEEVENEAMAQMLVLELYSSLDDKKTRKETVKKLLNDIKEQNKISNTIYEKALNILED